MRRKILISTDEANQRGELARINSEIAQMEEETRNLREQREAEARLQEARSRRDREWRRLNRINTEWQPYVKETKSEEVNIQTQKVDTAKFVFVWEKSSSVEEFVERLETDMSIPVSQEVAKFVRTVEGIPLKELPDHPPKFGEVKANNLTLPKE